MFAQKSGWCVASPSGTVASSISKLAGLNYNMNHPPDHQGDADDVITVVIIGSGFKQLNKPVVNKSRWSTIQNWELRTVLELNEFYFIR